MTPIPTSPSRRQGGSAIQVGWVEALRGPPLSRPNPVGLEDSTHPTKKPSGFTLVELLMTISIIAILAALLIVAIGRTGERAREEATRALITKVAGQVQERLEAFDRLKSQPQWTADAKALVTSYANNNQTVSLNQAKALLLKNRQRISFPQSFREYASYDPAEFIRMIDPQNTYGFTIPTAPTVLDYSAWVTDHPTHIAETESSAILYYVLTTGRVLGIPTVDSGEFKASEIRDTDGDGLVEFIDAWERPLRFYRWPTRLVCPSGNFDTSLTPPRAVIDRTQGASVLITNLPSNDNEVSVDQDDPTNVLYEFNANSTISQTFTEANYHTPRTYHHFLLVSGGPDGRTQTGDAAFGLYPPTDQYDSAGAFNTSTNHGYLCQPIPGQFDALTDNITNRNRP